MNSNSNQNRKFLLTKSKPSEVIEILPDRQIIQLTNFKIVFKPKVPISVNRYISIVCKLINEDSYDSKMIYNGHVDLMNNASIMLQSIGLQLYDEQVKEFNKFEVVVSIPDIKDDDFEVAFEYSNVDLRIGISFNLFKEHLDIPTNSRILFSSSFGQGKTTYLNEFFENYKESYDIIKIYPVNYSISSNEDIFKYIKCEVLYQLMKKGIPFDKENWNWKILLPEYLYRNPDKLFFSFLKQLPLIGKNLYNINLDIENIIENIEDFKKFVNEENKDDLKASKNFIEKYYEQEGTLYEGNIYTEIIRKLISRLKEQATHKLETVLLIDDLDRMDPEHIFRILNVFSAHFDNHIYEEQGLANKFGFDKVIIVCDLENIRNIYAHKYGEKCDFSGYINKYYSITPFIYDNKVSFLHFLKRYRPAYLEGSPFDLLKIIISDLVLANEFTIRQMKKFLEFDYSLILMGKRSEEYMKISNENAFNNLDFASFYIIYYLLKFYDAVTLKKKLYSCRGIYKYIDIRIPYNHYCLKYMFNPQLKYELKQIENEKVIDIEFKGARYLITFQENKDRNDEFGFHYGTKISRILNSDEVKLTIEDFYDALILDVDLYVNMGGLNGIPKI
jgi:hypothetical protein